MEYVYARLIQANPSLKTIDDVPLHLRDKVQALLDLDN